MSTRTFAVRVTVVVVALLVTAAAIVTMINYSSPCPAVDRKGTGSFSPQLEHKLWRLGACG